MDLSSLNPQQRDAVETIKGPVLILAGAGTGKTRVITFRMAWMIRRGIPPGNILGVTFTNKAAKEMKERIAQLVSKPRSKEDKKSEWLTISTFHSLGVRLLRQYIERLGYKKNFVIYSDSEQIGLIKRIMSNISSKGDKVDPREILSLLSRHKNAGPNSTAFADANVSALADIVRSRYDTALRACNAVDFDDLLVLTLRLLEEHSDVLEECRNRFQYVMVDEYQDTNAAQFKLVQLLTEKHRNLCVVGDDDQSIYGWRGAEIANLLDLEKYYPEVKVIKLEQNYRSTNVILKAANAVIKHNSRRRVKQLWSQKGQGENIRIVAFPNEDEEATSIVEAIEFNRLARGIPWANQAILYRTNIQSRPIEMALRKAGVRYHLVGGQSFFDRREVKDSMAYFKMFINPHDDNNLLRIANVPARGLSDVTMERLLSASAERHCSVYNAMQHTDILAEFAPRSRQSILDFVQLIEETRAPLVSGDAFALAPWSEKLFTEIGYIADLRKSEKNQETAENRIRNLKDILATLDDELMDYPKPLARFGGFSGRFNPGHRAC